LADQLPPLQVHAGDRAAAYRETAVLEIDGLRSQAASLDLKALHLETLYFEALHLEARPRGAAEIRAVPDLAATRAEDQQCAEKPGWFPHEAGQQAACMPTNVL